MLLIVVGVVVGFLSTRLMKIEDAIFKPMLIGVEGAVLGGVLLRMLLPVLGVLSGFVGAVLGALLVIWIWQTYLRR